MNALLNLAGALFLVSGNEPMSKPQASHQPGVQPTKVVAKTVTGEEIEAVKRASLGISKGIDGFENLVGNQAKRVDSYQAALQKARRDAQAWAKKLASERDAYKRNPPQCPDERQAYEAHFCSKVADCVDRQQALDKWSKAVGYARLALQKCKVQVETMRKQSEVVGLGIGELDALFTSARIVEASIEATKIQADLEKLQGNMGNMAQSLLGELKNLESELSKRFKSEPSKQFKQASAQLDGMLESTGN